MPSCAIQTGRSVGSLRRRRARYCLAATLFISPGLISCGGSATAPTDNVLDCTGSACIAVASFEADFDGWVPRTADAGPFLIERTMRRARDRQWSVELYAINSTAATHLWLQRAVRVAPNRRYDVRLEYALCCLSYASGSTNQFQLIADASTSPKPSVAPAFSYSPPDTHEDSSADAAWVPCGGDISGLTSRPLRVQTDACSSARVLSWASRYHLPFNLTLCA